MKENLKPQIHVLPNSPGCYIYKNKRKEIIYIGKSKSIKKRVKQYFSGQKEGKLEKLVKEIEYIDFMVTIDETDALFLECKLIKEHKPPYNSQLKRKRTFPFIKIDLESSYPSIVVSDEIQEGNDEYFGCFYSERDAINTLETLNVIWKTPICNKGFSNNSKVCLFYHIGKCCGPCEQKISQEEYREKISDIILLFKGKSNNTERKLKKDMVMYANIMEYEKAKLLRESIFLLQKMKKKVARLNTVIKKRDCFVFFRAFNEELFSIFFIKDGVVVFWEKFLDVEAINERQLEDMIKNIKNENFQIFDEAIIDHIFEIYADKLYVPIDGKYGKEKLFKLLIKRFKEFTEGV